MRLSYVGALERWDTTAIVDALADDVLNHVAVHDQPMRGNENAAFLFGVLAEELGDVTVTDELLEADKAVVLFETSIGQQTARRLVLRRAVSGEAQQLTALVLRSKAAWSYDAQFMQRAAAELVGHLVPRHEPRLKSARRPAGWPVQARRRRSLGSSVDRRARRCWDRGRRGGSRSRACSASTGSKIPKAF